MSLDLVQTAIVAAVAGGAGRVVAAPVDALAAEFQARVRERLSRTREKGEAKAGGELHRVADRIAYKALQEAARTSTATASPARAAKPPSGSITCSIRLRPYRGGMGVLAARGADGPGG